MAERSDRTIPNTQLLQELESLSHSTYQPHTTRRTASLVLPRTSAPGSDDIPSSGHVDEPQSGSRRRSRRMSISPWRSRTGHRQEPDDRDATKNQLAAAPVGSESSGEKKGIWTWKPMRALSHIRMQRLSCLFSVEVVAVQGLPPSMNGLRLCIVVRKKETKDGAVQTMPSRVLQGSADFEEMLFIRCHVYCNGGAGTGKPLKLEPRPFLISTIAIDAPELDFGRSTVDLSQLVRESMEMSTEGVRVRQWDTTFKLAGKAKGGELVLKLGFQIMEDGGVGIYNQVESTKSSSSSFARKQSKSSFSVTSPKVTRSEPSWTPTKEASDIDLKGIDDFNLDEPAPPPSTSPSIQKSEQESKAEAEAEAEAEDLDLPEFEVVDKGVEIQGEEHEEEEATEQEEADVDEASASSEVVKEVVQDSGHLVRLTELDEIAKQIKALESKISEGTDPVKNPQEEGMQRLDAEEETVTREFLQMLELEDETETKFDMPDLVGFTQPGAEDLLGPDGETMVFVSDLGKGLGPVVQTRDGGYLASMNPLEVEVPRKQTPKLAMQLSKPFILRDGKTGSGFEVFQRLAAMGSEELGSKLLSLTSMDELMGKTAEQIAFEGIASAIISGRSKEGASSSAARSVAVLKTMASAMSEGRKERIATGIWNMKEEPVIVEEILPFSLQKIEAMAVDALKIQAEVAEEEAPFDVSPLAGKEGASSPLDSVVIMPEDWLKACGGASAVTLLLVIQLRDPLRRYEAVGGPSVALVQASRVDGGGVEEEGRFKVSSLHVGGLKLKSGGGRRSAWDGEKQRLTGMHWLVAYGLAKAGRKSRPAAAKGGQDLVWSLSSRVMADMWLKPMRNPNIKVPEK